MATRMSQERRAAPRIAERIRFAITEGSTVLQAETKNLSTSGVYCLIDKFIAPMTKLAVEFTLPHKPHAVKIQSTGVVVRIEPVVTANQQGQYLMAIFFSDLSVRDRESIAAFVRDRLSSAGALH